MTRNSQLLRAIALFQTGKISDATTVFESIMARDRTNCDALHYFGILKAAMGRFSEAEELLQKSLSAKRTRIPYTENYVQILFQQHKYENAVGTCRAAIRAHGITEKLQYTLAISLFKGGRLEESLNEFDKLLNKYNSNIIYYNEKGSVLAELGRFEESLTYVERSLAINPKYSGALLNKGNLLSKLEKYHEALNVYNEAFAVAPASADLFLGYGNALGGLRRYDEALAAYDKALSINPDLENAWLGRGNVFWSLKRYDEALVAYDKALSIKCHLERAWFGRGNVFSDLKRYDEAFASYEKALSINPHFGEARFNEGFNRLLLGDMESGWKEYEWRWEGTQLRSFKRDFVQPQWSCGTDISKKTILIHAEQGLGDTIMCCRYVPMVAALGAEVIVEVQPPLKSLLQNLDGISTLIAKGEPIPNFDVQCPIMSLPWAFKTTLENIPAQIPYLSASENVVENWRSKLSGSGMKIGIAWAGNPNFFRDCDRSILLKNILPILQIKGARFFCLQKDLRDGDSNILDTNYEIVRLDREIHDFQDTAAIITLLDLVISSDTSVVNLAGAIGTPFWVLLPFNPDWRWLLDRDDSPWYPAARLFRQKKSSDWTTVVAEVCTELNKLIAQRK
jgi:tetratricopeptide (TPR) repeat protein